MSAMGQMAINQTSVNGSSGAQIAHFKKGKMSVDANAKPGLVVASTRFPLSKGPSDMEIGSP